ncbi:hypothetical protein niasHS_001775 [Heterodera schachtii]|uniref:RING-type domain-containing protein n=1 Tax=Heterodera schachtii TaxID=97005 RepID=A0ABD2I6P3_HETSC
MDKCIELQDKNIELQLQNNNALREHIELKQNTESLVKEKRDLEEEILRMHVSENSDQGCICALCYVRQRNYVCIPCGHFALCNRCAEVVAIEGTCPFCREQLDGVFKIFNP